MKKVLILGGSHRDIPIIQASKELGYYVITLANAKDYLGHSYAHQSYEVDFNDKEAVKKIIKKENIVYILPGCGEESYLRCVELSDELKLSNLDKPQTAELLHNKLSFKNFCSKHKISTPQKYTLSSNTQSLNFPLVVKPTNLSGGRGVEIVYTEDSLMKALNNAKKYSNEVFLEEFIDGELIAYSLFIKNKKVIYGFSGKDESFINPYIVTTAYPYDISKHTLFHLQSTMEKIATTLNLVDGMFHLQAIIKNDIPYIIDITRRIPGDLYPFLIEKCDGVSYSKAVVKSYIGKEITDEFQPKHQSKFVIRHVAMSKNNGTYSHLFIDKKIQRYISYRVDLLQDGSLIDDYLHTQIAIIFLELPTVDTEILKNLNKLIYPVFKETNR
ncbi:ATP-grasp domain-containing protein [Sulfurimonas sp. SAG-AH-194-C21]|nr:ATP-grasp domain-containing protein [Sulfurimonas sp. SAG-AH-194-C21]MDF1883740.1 ATP-grasp domain-containing protein [Sulfurimonas sp. SAG-AH-194-C21]